MGKPSKSSIDIRNTDLYKKICQILSEEIIGNVSDTMYNPDDDLVDDLGLDDLDGVEFVMCLEEEFNMSILDTDADKFRTLRNVYDYMVSKQPTK